MKNIEGSSPVRALVVGEGPQQERIANEIAGKDPAGAVRMTGYRQDIPEIVAASDVIVLPSDRFEGVPQVLLQSLAMGRSAVPFFAHYCYNSPASILSFEVSPSMTSMPPDPPEILSRSGKRRVFPIGNWCGSMFADRFVWLLAKTS